MDLKRIEHLIQVAEYGSFSKAASVIGIAQPALGRQVKKLEEECGTPLLYRHGRGVSLTPDGEKLLTRLRPLLRQMESAVLELRSDQESPSGTVSLGLTPTMSGMLGVQLIAAVKERYPQIQLNIVSGYSGYVHEWLINGRVDLAMLHDARRSQHIVSLPLAELGLSLISPAGMAPPGDGHNVRVAQLKGIPLVLPTRNHGLRRTVEYAASQAGVPLNVVLEIDALELMRELVMAGMGHTVLAAPAVREQVAAGTLETRLLGTPALSTRLLLATATNRPVTQAAKAVERIVRTLIEDIEAKKLYPSLAMLAPGA